MEPRYQTLSTIYDIVKTDAAPHTYLCTPHEIILRQTQDWDSIKAHLELLATEQLIVLKQLDKLAISITSAGIAKARSLKNNFINHSFTIPANNTEETTIEKKI